MLLELSKLKGLSLGVMDEGCKKGEVLQALFDPSQIKIIGLLIKPNKLLSQNKVVSLSDVIEVDAGGVVINSGNDILEVDDIIRIKKILRDKIRIIGCRAYSKRDGFLGYIYDGVMDSDTGDLMRFYVRFFFKKYVFGRSQVVEIQKKKIIFDTDSKINSQEAENLTGVVGVA